MKRPGHCIALATAGIMIVAPIAAIAEENASRPAFNQNSPVSLGETEAASIMALQQRAQTRQGAGANRSRPSKPKPAARNSSKKSVNHNRDRNPNRNSGNRNNNNRNRNNNRITNVSGNDVNINVDRNVRYDDHHHHHDHWDDWDDDWHPWATAAAVTMTAAVIGSIVASIPPDCSTVIVNGISYSQCGNTWYQPQYYGSSVQYVVVNPPR